MRSLFGYLFSFLLLPFAAAADGPLRIAATLSAFGSIAEVIGGERVVVNVIASPRYNPHFVEPRPSDVLKVKRADLVIHGGLDLEAWRGPLLDAAGVPELREGGSRSLDLSTGITLLEAPAGRMSRAQGDIHLFGNPHFWLEPENGLVVARSIAGKLAELDPAGAADYQTRLAEFEAGLRTKIVEWRGLLAPHQGAELAAFHNEWVYLTRFAGMRTDLFLEPKPGIQPSPRHLEELVTAMKRKNARAVIYAGYNPSDPVRFVCERTAAKPLALCQAPGERSECGDYIGMLDYNFRALAELLHG